MDKVQDLEFKISVYLIVMDDSNAIDHDGKSFFVYEQSHIIKVLLRYGILQFHLHTCKNKIESSNTC